MDKETTGQPVPIPENGHKQLPALSPGWLNRRVSDTKGEEVLLTKTSGEVEHGMNNGFLSYNGVDIVSHAVVLEFPEDGRKVAIPAQRISHIRQPRYKKTTKKQAPET